MELKKFYNYNSILEAFHFKGIIEGPEYGSECDTGIFSQSFYHGLGPDGLIVANFIDSETPFYIIDNYLIPVGGYFCDDLVLTCKAKEEYLKQRFSMEKEKCSIKEIRTWYINRVLADNKKWFEV